MIREINYEQTLPIRQKVLWPSLAVKDLYIKGDEHAVHYGFFSDNQLVGVISVFDLGRELQFRKFAVLPEFQRQGIGSALLTHIMNKTDKPMMCNARISATALYEKFGMKKIASSEFIKGNVRYIIMKKEN